MSGTTVIIPTLDSLPILTDPRDILGYTIRYYATAPKSVSDTTPKYMISLADTVSKYQSDPDALANRVIADLQIVLNRFFFSPNASTSVDVSTSDNGDGTFNLTIQIAAMLNGNPYTLGASVSVNSTGILQLKFHPSFA